MEVLLIFFISLLCIVGLRLAIKQTGTLFQPLTLFLGGFFHIFGMQAATLFDPVAVMQGYDAAIQSLILAALVLLTLTLSYASPIGEKIARLGPTLVSRTDNKALRHWAFYLLLVGLSVNVYSILQAGGFAAWDADADNRRALNVDSQYAAALDLCIPVAVALLLCCARKRSWEEYFVFALAAALCLFYFYVGSRSRTVSLVFIWVGALCFRTQRQPGIWAFAVFIIAGITASTFLANYRTQFSHLSFSAKDVTLSEALWESIPFLGTANPYQTQDITGMEFPLTAAVMRLVPSQISYAPEALEEFITRPIPRAWLPEGSKHYPYYEAITPLFFATNASRDWVEYGATPILIGPALGFVGHWYFIGGPFVLLPAAFLVGILFKAIASWARINKFEPAALAVCLFLSPIGFSEAAATPLFWIFNSLPIIAGFSLVLVSIRTSHPKLRLKGSA